MTENNERWIAEGWETFHQEVIGKGWPDSPALRLLIEVAFYGGANWLIHILEEEGTMPDVLLGRLSIELAAHSEHVQKIRRAIEP